VAHDLRRTGNGNEWVEVAAAADEGEEDAHDDVPLDLARYCPYCSAQVSDCSNMMALRNSN
jgi:hypothetical protein